MTRRNGLTPFLGWWKIVAMDAWDEEYINLVVPGFIDFPADGLGRFEFGTVRGWTDCRGGVSDAHPLVEFSWQGTSDGDDSCGRGWATVDGDHMEGRLYIHCGDVSGFVAERRDKEERTPTARRIARRR